MILPPLGGFYRSQSKYTVMHVCTLCKHEPQMHQEEQPTCMKVSYSQVLSRATTESINIIITYPGSLAQTTKAQDPSPFNYPSECRLLFKSRCLELKVIKQQCNRRNLNKKSYSNQKLSPDSTFQLNRLIYRLCLNICFHH